MPLFCLMYLIAYIDRQNVSYAKLEMVQALGLSEAAYGLGASLFFIGYFLFEAPSNLILARVGARVWFARIMFTWGLVHPGPGLHPERGDVLRPAVPAGRHRGGVLPRRASMC